MAITDVDPTVVRTTADNTFNGMVELETHLSRMSSAQDELYVAVKGNTGDAVYHTMGEAYQKGKKLAKDLQDIITVMKTNGVNFDQADLEEAQKLANSVDGSSWVGDGAAHSAANKLNLNGI
ncbi:WXG100 family type VII secretion target [Nocardia sp. CA-129566]|uniref:WXG100 family type VII secretion target n=1 Tax=Nocardia sp. CA-129566 TaxID=3239976 RepID=UPI003D962C51